MTTGIEQTNTATPTHPLGNVADPDAPTDDAKSIVDTLFKLDELMSGAVRRARKSASFYIRPDLEARLDELDAELASLVDSQGRPRTIIDQAVGDGTRSAESVALERQEVAIEMEASRRRIVFEQVDEDRWAAHLAKHKDTLDGEPPFTAEFYEETISMSAVQPTLSIDEVREIRKRMGRPVFDLLFSKAWDVNSRSGVSIPKSLISSAVLSQRTSGSS